MKTQNGKEDPAEGGRLDEKEGDQHPGIRHDREPAMPADHSGADPYEKRAEGPHEERMKSGSGKERKGQGLRVKEVIGEFETRKTQINQNPRKPEVEDDQHGGLHDFRGEPTGPFTGEGQKKAEMEDPAQEVLSLKILHEEEIEEVEEEKAQDEF